MATIPEKVWDSEGNLVSSGTVEVPQEEVNFDTLHERGMQALIDNKTFLAIASPTNAQNAAQVKALTRQVNGIIRLLLNRLEATD